MHKSVADDLLRLEEFPLLLTDAQVGQHFVVVLSKRW